MTLNDVKLMIKRERNEKRIAFDEKLNKEQSNFNGLSIPKMRSIAKIISKNNPNEFLDTNDLSSYELEQIHAMVICMLSDIDEALSYIKAYIPKIHGWAVNDTLCNHFTLARKHMQQTFDFLLAYKDSDKEFEQRVVAVMLLSHFLTDTYIDRVIVILDELKVHAYYAKMAVAWAYATILAKYPTKGLAYMNHHHLDDWTLRKTIQKSIESYRVSDEIKETLRQMRPKKK